MCPVDFCLTQNPFRLLKEVGFCCERTPVQFFRFVDVKTIFDKGSKLQTTVFHTFASVAVYWRRIEPPTTLLRGCQDGLQEQ